LILPLAESGQLERLKNYPRHTIYEKLKSEIIWILNGKPQQDLKILKWYAYRVCISADKK